MNGLLRLSKISISNEIFFLKEYAKLYLNSYDEIFDFKYCENGNSFQNIAIKKPILSIGEYKINEGFYDLETPYGYGGYQINSTDEQFILRAIEEYRAACIKERIIAEFIRIHPYLSIFDKVKNSFDFFQKNRETVYINLMLDKDLRWGQYSPVARNILRKNILSYEFTDKIKIEEFVALYKQSMDRNAASIFYRFDDEYFIRLLEIQGVYIIGLLKDAVPVAAAIIMINENIAYYHLAGSVSYYMKKNSNYFLIDFICDYIKNKFPEVEKLHLGGGRTADNMDSLYQFKAKFSKNRSAFYIAGNIFNKEVFNRYIEMSKKSSNNKNFLAYR